MRYNDMFRRLNQIVFVILVIIGIAAIPPSIDAVDNSQCTWTSDGPSAGAIAEKPIPRLSLSLRAPDVALAASLRPKIESGLVTAGITELVNNPLTWPRADVTVTEMDARWTPFWARLKLTTNIRLDAKKGGRKGQDGHDVDQTVVVEGQCYGLVGRSPWQAGAIDRLANDVVTVLVAPR